MSTPATAKSPTSATFITTTRIGTSTSRTGTVGKPILEQTTMVCIEDKEGIERKRRMVRIIQLENRRCKIIL